MKTIGDEGNGRNLPLFNAITSSGMRGESFVVKPKPKTAAAGSPPPQPPPKPPDNTPPSKDRRDGFPGNKGKEQSPESTKKRPPEDGAGGLVRSSRK